MKKAGALRETGGFAAYEMVLLIASLVVFLVGVVLLVNVGVDAIQPTEGERALLEEGERLLDDVEAIVKGAQVISLASLSSRTEPSDESLVFAADLDGTGGTFEVSQNGREAVVEGLQVVDLFRETPRKLSAAVGEGASEPEIVLLSDALDDRSAGAFTYRLLSSGESEIECGEAGDSGLKAYAIEVNLRLRMKGDTRSFSRVIHLLEPAAVALIE